MTSIIIGIKFRLKKLLIRSKKRSFYKINRNKGMPSVILLWLKKMTFFRVFRILEA